LLDLLYLLAAKRWLQFFVEGSARDLTQS